MLRNMILSPEQDRSGRWRFGLLFAYLGMMWLVFGIDRLLETDVTTAFGVVPRTVDGLEGLIGAPFFHADLEHIVGNTSALLLLGLIVLLRGANQFLIVVMICTLVSGAGMWLFGEPNSVHFGASGVVFGFIAFLLFRSVFDRRLGSFVVTALVAVLFGATIGWAAIPEKGISWIGHVSGFVGGLIAARFLRPRTLATTLVEDALETVNDESQGNVRRWRPARTQPVE